MDLGIRGRRALVTGASRGLGQGCARALAEAGVDLVLNARGADSLEETAAVIRREHGTSVRTVVADMTTPDGQAAVIAAAAEVDILVTNVGGPPPGVWRDWSREDFQAALDANMLAPIALIQALLPGMCDRGWGRVVNITSTSVKAPLASLGLSTAARSGLTGYVAGTSRAVARFGVTINNLLPGSHDTARLQALDRVAIQNEGITAEEARARRIAGIPVGRYGTPQEFGAMCAFLCSTHAGYIVGQNIVLDGGSTNVML
ncbi:SDR family oxidoreductase [Rubellimicrobium rubrum]|uniref:SDR family oxidoreductase n=1 Tax=Rubellimicrobium rubrum TaxID=2585369 RepID=A0A5C4MYH9_9RHOB|nr:SDR family oxidoreductase [Rubellimicrobium rubrum]TNC50734.1 SDR family oxidoreductase [Rubellimicrobium rubrum]